MDHNFGSRHARRSSKGSINAGYYLVSQKSFSQNFGPLNWRPGPIKVGQKNQNTPTLRARPSRTPHPNKKFLFNRTKKTCCIRRGFEQLSSYSGWRVITRASFGCSQKVRKLHLFSTKVAFMRRKLHLCAHLIAKDVTQPIFVCMDLAKSQDFPLFHL